ncbi:39S ribosomal protein L22, mitochondrial-like [Penaeus chinensis]|uniref:39S ribosomal protein L22, mitochondrial-like n=1 Tax=Penaeus chinensis TaxID=139456 RepID=UPI001FB7BE57|nr:39S ribosomal protein L22, mitochondrial-like [Penaeus chinensis]
MAASISRVVGLAALESSLFRLSLGTIQRPLLCTTASNLLSPSDTTTPLSLVQKSGLHTSTGNQSWERPRGPRKWLLNNQTKFAPTPFGEQERPAYVCHVKENVKYSPDKMWYVACLVRGMKIDDAIHQLQFVHKKGAVAVREALEEAQEMAVRNHNVEFKSNLWVSESFVGKGLVIKGFRRHARRRFGHVKYKHCHYFVTLEEGEPPEHYYPHSRKLTPQEMLEEWLESKRKRTIPMSL